MKKNSGLLLLSLLALLLAGPAASSAAEPVDPACSLFAVEATSEQPPLAPESLAPAPLAASLACSAICSFPDCLGAWDGDPCTRFNGFQGTCRISGRSCSPGEQHCSCT